MITNQPDISVIMPLYNKEDYVGEAVESVLSQLDTNFELIVVNDGSTDNSIQNVQNFNDDRLRIISQENLGVSAARNSGIKEAKSDLLAFIDADDIWAPNYLKTILNLRNDYPQCKILATGYQYIYNDGSKVSPFFKGLLEHPWSGIIKNYFEIASKSDPPLCSSVVTVYKNAVESIGGFPEGVTSGEDLLTWARLAAKFTVAYNSEPHAFFRLPPLVNEKPTREPQKPDYVGDNLKVLLNNNSYNKKKFIKKYIALWHKNRANMYLRLGHKANTFGELLKMARYDISLKLFIYLFVLILPMHIVRVVFRYGDSKK